MFALHDHTIVRSPPATTQGALVPLAEPQVPATVTKAATLQVIDQQRQFSSLMELRGSKPTPTRLLTRIFTSGLSWPLLTLGTGATLAAPGVYLFGSAAIGVDIVATFAATFLSLLGATGPFDGTPGPLRIYARNKHLTPKDLKFIADGAPKSPLEQATLGLLAERWMKRIDAQQVYGEAAHATLERLATEAKQLPEGVLETARKIIALRDAMLDPDTGQPLRHLGGTQIQAIVAAFEALPIAERRAVGPELSRLYFKGEVPRVKMESHDSARAFYRTLRDCAVAKPEENE